MRAWYPAFGFGRTICPDIHVRTNNPASAPNLSIRDCPQPSAMKSTTTPTFDMIQASAAPGAKQDRELRYKAIYQDLVAGIRSGQYPLMSLLPTELDLCARYQASRHTVREAIRMLTEAGMVSRRPGVGTRIDTRPAADPARASTMRPPLRSQLKEKTVPCPAP